MFQVSNEQVILKISFRKIIGQIFYQSYLCIGQIFIIAILFSQWGLHFRQRWDATVRRYDGTTVRRYNGTTVRWCGGKNGGNDLNRSWFERGDSTTVRRCDGTKVRRYGGTRV